MIKRVPVPFDVQIIGKVDVVELWVSETLFA